MHKKCTFLQTINFTVKLMGFLTSIFPDFCAQQIGGFTNIILRGLRRLKLRYDTYRMPVSTGRLFIIVADVRKISICKIACIYCLNKLSFLRSIKQDKRIFIIYLHIWGILHSWKCRGSGTSWSCFLHIPS